MLLPPPHPPSPTQIKSKWKPCIFPVSHLTEQVVSPLKQWESSTKMLICRCFFLPHTPPYSFPSVSRLPNCRGIGDGFVCVLFLSSNPEVQEIPLMQNVTEEGEQKQIKKKKNGGKETCYLSKLSNCTKNISSRKLISCSSITIYFVFSECIS